VSAILSIDFSIAEKELSTALKYFPNEKLNIIAPVSLNTSPIRLIMVISHPPKNGWVIC
jgi:hypothetical protein